jgi:hypothetical protein
MPNLLKMLMASGVSDTGPQVIAPTRFDETFAQDEWPYASNPLGDHTIGMSVNPTGGNSGLFSLETFDGAFEVEFTLGAAFTDIVFGIHALEEDDHRVASGSLGLDAMTKSYWFDEEQNDFFIGSTDEVDDPYTWDSGDRVKITRDADGTITFWDNDVSVIVFSGTCTDPMRFALGADTVGGTVDVDNLKFTDTDKVQRDGFFNETSGGDASATGTGAGYTNHGVSFIATQSGIAQGHKEYMVSKATPYNAHAEIWSDNAGSPGAQLGTDGDSQDLNLVAVGDVTFDLLATGVSFEKGTRYWVIVVDEDGGSGSVVFSDVNVSYADHYGGRHNTITSITDNVNEWRFETIINTTGEPTPGYDTLLLIHSDTTDGSTTFVDSSQFARTITVGGHTQHDTAQALGFGTSSMLFDGTGDNLTVPDSLEWNKTGVDFTIDFIFRVSTLSKNQLLCSHATSSAYSGINILLYVKTTGIIECLVGNNGGAGVQSISTTTVLVDTNYHVAMIKLGGNLLLAVDGTIEDTTSGTMAHNNLSTPFNIGGVVGPYLDLQGWIKEFRYSNVARWDADFTPQTIAYPS